jgi:hypothetical protein
MRLLLPPRLLRHRVRDTNGVCASSSRLSATVVSLDSLPMNWPSHLDWSSTPRRARASIAACTALYKPGIVKLLAQCGDDVRVVGIARLLSQGVMVDFLIRNKSLILLLEKSLSL